MVWKTYFARFDIGCALTGPSCALRPVGTCGSGLQDDREAGLADDGGVKDDDTFNN